MGESTQHREVATGRDVRSRAGYLAASVATIGTGLLWRSGHIPLPALASKYGGDALWAAMVYWLVRFCHPRGPRHSCALAALTFAFVVEFSQLYQAPWIDGLRATRLGRLTLGQIFNPPDLAAYAIGIGLAVIIDGTLLRRFATK